MCVHMFEFVGKSVHHIAWNCMHLLRFCIFCAFAYPKTNWIVLVFVYILYECAGKCLILILMLMPIHAFTFFCVYVNVCALSIHSIHSIVFIVGLNLIKSVLTNSNEVQYNNIRSNKAKRISFLCAEIYPIAPTPTSHSRHTSFYTIPFLNSKEEKKI